ncbi:MAG TPA: NAD-dependent epimerase/dehydratase family protein [Candidatus Binataceae bacterium]|nr:NAD-dependent epimerase/dehydratase family protein [Candidatus Binataceae bacterium]
MNALVIGGTGPTGHFIVNGLVQRGYRVAMLHTGRHELDEIPPIVEHIHTDPFSADALRQTLGSRTFDLTIAAYGRLRVIAELLRDKTERFMSIGGVPAYRGYMNPTVLRPQGLPVPTSEDAPLVPVENEDPKGWRVAQTEEIVFRYHPNAVHFRYPFLYGPYQVAPREWCVVRRIIEGRRAIILPEDGLPLNHSAYVENAAHAVLLAVDKPEAASGQIYNCGDEQLLNLRQTVEVIAEALGHELEIVSMPWRFAITARPMMAQPWITHRVLDLTKIKTQLGYADRISPERGLALTARWLREHPLERGGAGEKILQDPFDYRAEDELIAAWKSLCTQMPSIKFDREPGYTATYSGPGGKPRTSSWS